MTSSERIEGSFGRYQLRSRLGVGGFAEVFRGHDPGLDADVAIKVLFAHLANEPEMRRRFVDEARILRRIDSNHVIRVFDIGEHEDGRPYFVMELAAGGSLAGRLSAAIDRSSLEQLIAGLAEGLGALHSGSLIHRDIKPENLLIVSPDRVVGTQVRSGLLASDERVVISDLGLVRDHSRTEAGRTLIGGSLHYSAPEQMIEGGQVGPATDVYASSAVLWRVLSGQDPPAAGGSLDVLGQVPAPWRPLFERGLASDPVHRHATIAEWAQDATTALEQTDFDHQRVAPVATPAGSCPYKGMAAFQPDDASLFCGRDELVDQLLTRLREHGVLVVGGPSGSGKSSLVRAGLMPKLSLRSALLTPTSDAVGELMHHIRRLTPDDPTPLDASDLPAAARRRLDDGQTTLLVIDQFEELFTLNHQDDDRRLFIDTLAELTSSEHSPVKVALALRADFYGDCARYPWLADRINQNQILVGPMPPESIREAIVTPARRAGLELEDGLVDAVIADAGSGVGSLPLLGHALMETWLRRRGRQLTVEGYRAAGGVAGAIAQRAEETVSNLPPAEQDAARRLLLRLTNPGQGTADTRRRVPLDSLRSDEGLSSVLEKLASARLLSVDGDSAEVTHEALLHSWPRLQNWIDDARDSLLTRRRISAAAAEWDRQDRTDDLLYRGTPLASASEWLLVHRDELDDAGIAFVEEGQRQQAELEHELAEAEHRQQRGRRAALLGLTGLALAAIVASVVALIALRQSQSNERAAQESQGQALASAADSSASSQPLVGLALALESLARTDPPSPEARDAVVEARAALDSAGWQPLAFGDPVFVGDVLSVIVSRDGSRFVTGDRDGRVVFYDTLTRQPTADFGAVHEGSIEALATSPDGRWLASGDDDGMVVLWDLSDPDSRPRVLLDVGSIAWSLSFAPDSSALAVGTESGRVQAFDLDGEALGPGFEELGVDVLSTAFLTPTLLVVADGRGDLRIVVAASGEVVVDLTEAHGSFDIWEVDVGPAAEANALEGARVFTTLGEDRTFKIWDWDGADATLRHTIDQLARPRGAAVIRQGRAALVGDSDGAVHRIDLEIGELVDTGMTIAVHEDNVTDFSMSESGYAVSLADDQTVQVWLTLGSESDAFVTLADELIGESLAVSPGEGHLAVATDDSVEIRTAEGGLLSTVESTALAVVFMNDDRLVTSSSDGLLSLWNSSGGLVSGQTGHAGQAIRGLAASPDGLWLASSADDGSIVVWSADLEKHVDLGSHGRPVYAVTFSADGTEVFTVGFDQMVRRWSRDGGQLGSFRIDQSGPRAIAVHPSEAVIAIGGADERVDLFDLDGRPVRSLGPVEGGVWQLQFLENGRTIVAASERGFVRLWDTESGTPLGPIFQLGGGGRVALAGQSNAVFWVSSESGGVDGQGGTQRIDLLDTDKACELTSSVMSRAMLDRHLGRDVEALACS